MAKKKAKLGLVMSKWRGTRDVDDDRLYEVMKVVGIALGAKQGAGLSRTLELQNQCLSLNDGGG